MPKTGIIYKRQQSFDSRNLNALEFIDVGPNMRILMVVAYFVPEIGSAAHIFFDLARAFARRGHSVDVITSYPREFNLSSADSDRKFPEEEIIEDINIHRCRHPVQRDNIILRGAEHFLLPIFYLKKYKKLSKKFDICLTYIPPLPLYYLARKLKSLDGLPTVLSIQDFHPQELTDVGVLKNPIMIKIMEHIEYLAYSNADFITVLSKGGVDYITKRGGNPDKIRHIYNGCNIAKGEDIKKDFKIRENIERKFLVTYAGILSPFQGIDKILDEAKKLRSHENIIFYIIGDGMIKQHLIDRIEEEGIFNVKLLPLQPRDEYLNIINSSDVSIISLDERMKTPCVPGKLMNLFMLKQPILAVVPETSETARVIVESKSGDVALQENLKDIILKLIANKQLLQDMGENGNKFLMNNMNLEKNVEIYEDIFNRFIDKNQI